MAERIAKTFSEILKFNPNHDRLGMFCSAGNATSFTIRTKDPKKQYLADLAIARAKENDAKSATSTATATTPKTHSKTTEKPQNETETPRTKKLHEVEDKIRNQNFESASIVNKNGEELLFKDGQKSEVSFSHSESLLMRGNTLTHNHPRCSMFSKEDLQCMAMNDMYEIRATNRDGTTYSMKQGKGYSKEGAINFAKRYGSEYPNSSSYAQRDLDNRGFGDKIWRGEISMDEANREFGRASAKYMVEWTQKNAAAYGLEFTVEQREVKKAYTMDDSILKADNSNDGYFALDRKQNDIDDKAFKEWLQKVKERHSPTAKSFNEVVKEGE